MRGLGRFLVGHGLFLVVLAGAVAVRWIAVLGYPTVLWFGDSNTYLESALRFEPSPLRPGGYSVFLWLLKPFHSFLVVLAAQHALGVLTGLMVYALVWRAFRAGWPRRGVWLPGLVASLVSVPVLYDAYQIQLEHMLVSDGVFTFLLAAAITVVLWNAGGRGWGAPRTPDARPRRLSWWAGALAGLLISAAAMVRSVGLPMLIVLLVCMLVMRSGRRAMAAAVAAAAVPVALYMSWFHSVHGKYAITTTDKIWLYGRTVDFARCDIIKPAPDVAVLCRDHLPPEPGTAPAFQALWGEDSGFKQLPGWMYDPEANRIAGEFAMAAITKQPGDYARVIVRDTFRAFEWERKPYPRKSTVEEYEFPVGAALRDDHALRAYPYGGDTAEARVVEPYAGWMRDYQDRVFVRGPYLGVLMAVGLLGVLVRVRRLGGEVLLPWSVALALLVVPAATADFDYRYVLPAIPFAALGAGVTFSRRPRSRRPRAAAATPAGAKALSLEPPRTDPEPSRTEPEPQAEAEPRPSEPEPSPLEMSPPGPGDSADASGPAVADTKVGS
ncbi:hypothetical protein Arub01_00090 [Actinomadura rubrobrunea]|uniref:Uncharacterized protein n=2 Tax=Actinomadura rubrobrunea TaxID=115335 RepID=A0A9W6PNS7_9ACTN|nr:hypothetical protein Arub01_00090 [Actinomadura rubrobrunea]